ncbi:kinase-like domain-containing protein [Trichoderma velutinum]
MNKLNELPSHFQLGATASPGEPSNSQRDEEEGEVKRPGLTNEPSKSCRILIRKYMNDTFSKSKLDFYPECTFFIGEGGFGTVYKESGAFLRKGVQWIAVKCIYKRVNPIFEVEKDNIIREIVTAVELSEEDKEVFVGFFGWTEDKNCFYLALEYVELGDLEASLGSAWSEDDTKLVIQQLLRGITIMHRRRVAHRDLKPQNIFLVSRAPPHAKIGDFGISKKVPRGSTTKLNTRFATGGYCAPEITSKKPGECYTEAIDLWSLGCILYRMIVGEKLFQDDWQAVYKYTDTVHGLSAVAGKLNANGTDLLKSLIAIDPNDRPTAEEALLHAWFH